MLSMPSASMDPRYRFPMATKNTTQITKKKLKTGHSKKGTLTKLLKHKDGNDEIRDCSQIRTKHYNTRKKAN